MLQRWWIVLIALLLCVSCSKEETAMSSSILQSQFSFHLSSGVYSVSTSDTSYTTETTSQTTIISSQLRHTTYSSRVYRTTGLRPAIVVTKGKLSHSDSLPSDAAFASFFEPGDHSFSVNAQNGFEVLCVDMDGALWNTSEMGGYQGTNRFRIVRSTPFYDNGVFCVKIQAVFTCTLYHPAYASMELANGYFEGHFKNE